MHKLNLRLISCIGVCALLLTIIALPTLGERALAHWALTVGAFFSALVISLLYVITALIAVKSHKASHTIILATYIPALVICSITGALWGIVGHLMETEKVDFYTAFSSIEFILYSGYALTVLILACTLTYVVKQRRTAA